MFSQLSLIFCRTQKAERSCCITLNCILNVSFSIPSAASCYNTLNYIPEAKSLLVADQVLNAAHTLSNVKIFTTCALPNFDAFRVHSLIKSKHLRVPHIKAASTHFQRTTYTKPHKSLYSTYKNRTYSHYTYNARKSYTKRFYNV